MNLNKIFAKHIIFPMQDLRTHIGTYLKELEKSQWLSNEEIQKIQLKKLINLLNYVYLNVPYYKELFDQNKISLLDIKSFSDLKKIPILSKKDIHKNFSKMLANNIDKKKLLKQSTSGSTGEPVTILRDLKTDRTVSAAGIRFRRWAGHDIGEKFARIWGRAIDIEPVNNKDLSFKSKIWKKINNITDPVTTLSAFGTMSEDAMENFFRKIKKEKINHLTGYVSVIFLFSQYISKNHPCELKLKSVRTIAEMLYNHQRQFIEKTFNCKVFDTYGNRENGLIAAECSYHEGYHISDENLFIEILNSKGESVPMGEIGEIAITDLNNYAMPLIRYLTGDSGNFCNRNCLCGRGLTMLEKVYGRVIDMLTLSDGNLLNGAIFINFMWNFIDEVERFKVIQHFKGEAELYLKLSKPFTKERFDLLQKGLREAINDKISINYHIVDELPLQESGKYRYIISYV